MYETKRLLLMVNHEQSVCFQAPPLDTSIVSRNEPQPHCEQLNRGDFDNVQSHAIFYPIAAAERRNPSASDQTSRSNHGMQMRDAIIPFQQQSRNKYSPEQKVLGQRSPTQTCFQGKDLSYQAPNSAEVNVGRMVAAMASPYVEVYDDPKGTDYESFVAKFKKKYQSLGLSEDVLIHLFASKLSGHPKSTVQVLPKKTKESSLDSVLDDLRKRFGEVILLLK